jgi:3,5-epimerase/4-reductase
MKVLLYGYSGWLGRQIYDMFVEQNIEVISSNVRLDDYANIGKELDETQPTHLLLAAGLTGMPNIDWCESNKPKVLSVNVIGTTVLADECRKRKIHLTYLGTGCIYEYDEDHPMFSHKGFTEDDEPNFQASYYSKTKIIVEKILKEMDNTLILRIRMPLSDDLHPRNFITKISKYEKVVDVQNSMTVITDLLPVVVDMLIHSKVGIYNFTNPGTISHNQILALYKRYIDPSFEWKNFSLEDQAKILKAGRSNNYLDSSKLTVEYPEIPHISTSIVSLFQRMAEKK